MLLGDGFQFLQPLFENLDLFMQFIHLLDDILLRITSCGFGERQHQRLDAALLFLDLPLDLGDLGIAALPIALYDLLGHGDLPGHLLAVFAQLHQEVYNLCVQRIAVCIFQMAHMAIAALFRSTHIGVNRFPGCIRAAGQFRPHIIAAAAADQQPGEQGHITPGLAIALGFIEFQQLLNADPHSAGDYALMFAHRHDPFLHRLFLVGLSRLLQSTVIGHDTMPAVKIGAVRKQFHALFRQVFISSFIRNHIDGVGQNTPDGKAGKCFASFCPVFALQQKGICLGQGLCFQKLVKNPLDQIDLVRNDFQLARLPCLSIHRHTGDALGFIPGGSSPSQPAPGFSQLVHIVPDALCNGFPLQLGKDRGNVHHGPSHWGRCVKLFPDGDKIDLTFTQVLDQLGKVPNVTTDAVKTVDHDGRKWGFLGVFHHLFELGALQIAA